MKFMAFSAISYLIWHAQLEICELKTKKTKENKRKTILEKKKKLLRLTKSYTKNMNKEKETNKKN